jgi:hypothetical protein
MYDGEYRTADTGANRSGERSATSEAARGRSVASATERHAALNETNHARRM